MANPRRVRDAVPVDLTGVFPNLLLTEQKTIL
jgi:hypothetical protein